MTNLINERVSILPEGPARALLVDDDTGLLSSLARSLSRKGVDVRTTTSASEAISLLTTADFDVMVSDIMMPEMDGLQLLRTVRASGLEIPVILMTGVPAVETAAQAVAYGALRYLTKPFDVAELAHHIQQAARMRRLAIAKQDALNLVGGGGSGVAERASLEAAFKRALDSLWIAFQPIIRAEDRTLFGYEALMRTKEKSLPHPGAVLDAAERLDKLTELGRAVRNTAAESMGRAPEGALVFVNLHSRDLNDPALFSTESPLSTIASRVVLEITERASLDGINDVPARVASLRKLGYRIAIDDLGAGYAGLTSFAALEPEVVKLDMSLVRDVDKNATKQRLVKTMTSLAHEMGIVVVGEGVETVAERNELVSLKVDLLQGYLHAKPAEAFPQFTWGG